MSRKLASRYPPALVALHGLLALMIVGSPPAPAPSGVARLDRLATAAHHEFALPDGRLRRMWFGRRELR